MKTLLNAFAVALVGSLNLGTFSALADLEVSGSVRVSATADFHAPLSAHGAWVEVGSYGHCWRPASVAVEWSPYSHGHWVWTDCGWYWASDEPWGWACYHYGYWAYDPVHAWIWIPGIEWAPAWVSWRVGGGYIGWAPFAPAHVRVHAPRFVFVEVHRFREPMRPSTVIVNNRTIIQKTTVINNIKHETRRIDGSGPQKVVVNEGPGMEVVQKATGKKVEVASIREVARQTPAPAALTAKAGGSKEKRSGPTAEQPKPATEVDKGKQTDVDKNKQTDVDKNKQPPADRVGPQPEKPSRPPGAAPKRSSKSSQGKGGPKGEKGDGKAREQGPQGPGRDK